MKLSSSRESVKGNILNVMKITSSDGRHSTRDLTKTGAFYLKRILQYFCQMDTAYIVR